MGFQPYKCDAICRSERAEAGSQKPRINFGYDYKELDGIICVDSIIWHYEGYEICRLYGGSLADLEVHPGGSGVVFMRSTIHAESMVLFANNKL